jgi:hypothetical protein
MKSVLKTATMPIGVMAALAVIAVPAYVYAQGKNDAPQVAATPTVVAQEPPAPSPAPAAQPAGNFSYVAQPGDSLSVMVRRSLQQFDQEFADVTLTPSAAIFAETAIVQRMGSPLLEIGQNVSIPRNLVVEYAAAGTKLSPEQVAAWQPYAAAADFNVTAAPAPVAASTPAPQATPAPQNTPTPAPTTEATATPAPEASATPAATASPEAAATPDPNATPAIENPEGANTEATPGLQATDNNTDNQNSSAPWYWWLVGAGTLGVLYYLLSGRKSTDNKD